MQGGAKSIQGVKRCVVAIERVSVGGDRLLHWQAAVCRVIGRKGGSVGMIEKENGVCVYVGKGQAFPEFTHRIHAGDMPGIQCDEGS